MFQGENENDNETVSAVGQNRVRLAVVGSGAELSSTYVPALQHLKQHFDVRTVLAGSQDNAEQFARQLGAENALTDYQEILDDDNIDALLIAARHHLRATPVLDALRANKHVFVTRPLLITPQALAGIEQFYEEFPRGESAPLLMLGFHRTFSPHAQRLMQILRLRTRPTLLNYRIFVHQPPQSVWAQQDLDSKHLNDLGHVAQLAMALIEAQIENVQVNVLGAPKNNCSRRASVVVTMQLVDGSLVNILYSGEGSVDYPREQLEVASDGLVLTLEDYRALRVYGSQEKGVVTQSTDDGKVACLTAFAEALSSGAVWPVPLWQQIQALQTAFTVSKQLT